MAEQHSLPRKPLPTHTLDWETSKPRPSSTSFLARILPRRSKPPAATTATTTSRRTSYLDRLLPPHKRYLNSRLSRRAFLALLAALALALLLALILGLALGLRNRGSSQPLPLPGTGITSTGDLTYYDPGLGACGATNFVNESIVAVSHALFDAAAGQAGSGSNPNANPLCGKVIRISSRAAGANRSVDVTVRDRCTGCAVADLDVTESVFDRLAQRAEGRVKCSWVWV